MAQVKLGRILRKLSEVEGYLMLEMPRKALEILGSHEDWATMKFAACLLEGEAWRMLGQFQKALIPLEAAAALKPGDPQAAVALGWCYKRTHKLAQAIDALLRAVQSNPTLAILHYNLACYWCLAGDTSKALNALATSLELDPDYREMLAAESDFDGIRQHPEFARLAGASTELA
jgi:Flp pilus assembly protein TadD